MGEAAAAPIYGDSTGSPASAGTSLVVEPAIEPVLTDNFNPFDASSPLGAMGAPDFIYEPLLQYDELQVDQYYPWLAQSWTFSTSGLTITFNLRSGVHWDDGSPLTAADVAYTFNLLRAYPAIAHGLPIVSAVASSPSTFVLTLSRPGYSYLYDIAQVPIVKAGFASGHDPSTYAVKDPDGTGPFMLARPSDASRSRVVLTARPKYWQSGSPSVSQLVFPAYKDVGAVQAALASGALDWAGNFMPDVARDFLDKDQKDNHFWAPPVGMVSLVPNLGRYPLDQAAVREAISQAISRKGLSQSVTGGVDPPATSSTGLVVPVDGSYLSASQANDVDSTAQAVAAAKTMTAAGFHLGPRYWEDRAGKAVAFTISAQAGTVDASVAVALAAQLRASGFDVTATSLSARAWASTWAGGNFTAALYSVATGPSPYYLYQGWMSSRAAGADPAPAAKKMLAPSVALARYQDNPPTSAAATSAIKSLAAYVSDQVAVVPLMYSVAWAEYSTRHATGWPNGANPYEPASPSAPFDEYTVLQLTPTG